MANTLNNIYKKNMFQCIKLYNDLKLKEKIYINLIKLVTITGNIF